MRKTSRALLLLALGGVLLSGGCGRKVCPVIPAQVQIVEERREVRMEQLQKVAKNLDRYKRDIETMRRAIEITKERIQRFEESTSEK